MAPSPDQRAAFGRRLKELRGPLSQEDVASRLVAAGHPTTSQNVGAWERGEYGPRHARVVEALEEILGAKGELTDLLGYRREDDALLARVDAIEATQRLLLEAVARLEDELSRRLGA